MVWCRIRTRTLCQRKTYDVELVSCLFKTSESNRNQVHEVRIKVDTKLRLSILELREFNACLKVVGSVLCLTWGHVGLPEKTGNRKEKKATMRDKTRDPIPERFSGELKDLIKALLKRLMLKERAIWLEEHPTRPKATTPGISSPSSGPLKSYGCPRCGKGISIPNLPQAYLHRAFRGDPLAYDPGVRPGGSPGSWKRCTGRFTRPRASPAWRR